MTSFGNLRQGPASNIAEADPTAALMVISKANRKSWSDLKKVAFVRGGAVGDVTVGLAALREMKNFFPSAKITVIGSATWIGLLEPSVWPEIERIAVVEKKSQIARVLVRSGDEWAVQIEAIPLKKIFETCDGVVNTNLDSLRFAVAALRARVRVRIGSAPAHLSWVYTHSSPWLGKNPLIHERDAALFILEFATSCRRRFFRSTRANRQCLSAWLQDSALLGKWRGLGLPAAKIPNLPRAEKLTARKINTYLLVNPTSSRRTNTWPSDRFYELLISCRNEFASANIEPLILGAPNETTWLQEVAKSGFRIVQPAGFRELQDVLAGATALLTNTSSLQFVAASTKTPVFTIMGRGIPEIWGPLGSEDQIIRGRPPAHLDDKIFEQELAAYESLSVEEVRAGFLKWLNERLMPSGDDKAATRRRG